MSEGIMVCRRGLMVLLKMFVDLFIGCLRVREIKGEVGARGVLFVRSKHCRNVLILVVKVHMPLPSFSLLSISLTFTLYPFFLLELVKEKKKDLLV